MTVLLTTVKKIAQSVLKLYITLKLTELIFHYIQKTTSEE